MCGRNIEKCWSIHVVGTWRLVITRRQVPTTPNDNAHCTVDILSPRNPPPWYQQAF